jgi:hypothetical protein
MIVDKPSRNDPYRAAPTSLDVPASLWEKWDRLLAKIPGNGFKTFAGFILWWGPSVAGGLPWPELSHLVEALGAFLFATGLAHKGVKERATGTVPTVPPR